MPEEKGDRHAVGHAEQREPPAPVQRLLRRLSLRFRKLQRRPDRRRPGRRGRRRAAAAGEPRAVAQIQVQIMVVVCTV